MSKFISSNNSQVASEEKNLEKLKIIADRLGRESLDPTSLLFALAGSKTFEESVEWSKSLLDAGAKIEIRSEENSLSQLSLACLKGNFKVAKILLEEVLKDDDLAAEIIPAISDDKDRPTLLHYCAATNVERNPDLPEFLELVLQSEKAKVNAQDTIGYTPLMIATLWRNQPAASLFLQHGAKLDAVNSYGRDAESLAEADRNDGFLELFRQERARRNKMLPQIAQDLRCHYYHANPRIDDYVNNQSNGSLLHYACHNSNEKVVKKLIEMDADIERVDKFGFTPIFKSCLRGNVEAFSILMDSGANLKAVSYARENMLHVISRIDLKSLPNQEQIDGVLKITQCLVDAGVDIKALNIRGATPIDLARTNFKEVSEILERKSLQNDLLKQQEAQKIALRLNKRKISQSNRGAFVELQGEHSPIPILQPLPKKELKLTPTVKEVSSLSLTPVSIKEDDVPNPSTAVGSEQGAQLLKTNSKSLSPFSGLL